MKAGRQQTLQQHGLGLRALWDKPYRPEHYKLGCRKLLSSLFYLEGAYLTSPALEHNAEDSRYSAGEDGMLPKSVGGKVLTGSFVWHDKKEDGFSGSTRVFFQNPILFQPSYQAPLTCLEWREMAEQVRQMVGGVITPISDKLREVFTVVARESLPRRGSSLTIAKGVAHAALGAKVEQCAGMLLRPQSDRGRRKRKLVQSHSRPHQSVGGEVRRDFLK